MNASYIECLWIFFSIHQSLIELARPFNFAIDGPVFPSICWIYDLKERESVMEFYKICTQIHSLECFHNLHNQRVCFVAGQKAFQYSECFNGFFFVSANRFGSKSTKMSNIFHIRQSKKKNRFNVKGKNH